MAVNGPVLLFQQGICQHNMVVDKSVLDAALHKDLVKQIWQGSVGAGKRYMLVHVNIGIIIDKRELALPFDFPQSFFNGPVFDLQLDLFIGNSRGGRNSCIKGQQQKSSYEALKGKAHAFFQVSFMIFHTE